MIRIPEDDRSRSERSQQTELQGARGTAGAASLIEVICRGALLSRGGLDERDRASSKGFLAELPKNSVRNSWELRGTPEYSERNSSKCASKNS